MISSRKAQLNTERLASLPLLQSRYFTYKKTWFSLCSASFHCIYCQFSQCQQHLDALGFPTKSHLSHHCSGSNLNTLWKYLMDWSQTTAFKVRVSFRAALTDCVMWDMARTNHRARGHSCLFTANNCITSDPLSNFRPPDDSSCCLPGQRHPWLTRWSAVVSFFIEHPRQEASTGISRCKGEALKWPCSLAVLNLCTSKQHNCLFWHWGHASMKLAFLASALLKICDVDTVAMARWHDRLNTPKPSKQSLWFHQGMCGNLNCFFRGGVKYGFFLIKAAQPEKVILDSAEFSHKWICNNCRGVHN